MSEAATDPAAAEVPAGADPAAPAPEAPKGAPSSVLGDPEKPADPAAPDAPAEPEPERVGAPEKYEFAAPEGVELDAERLEAFQGHAKEAGLTQKQFATLAPKAIEMVQQMQNAAAEQWHAMQRDWQGQIAADPELAGPQPGTLSPEASAAAARVIEAHGGAELRQALALTGAGNNPHIVRAFVSIGKLMAEEANVAGGVASGTPRDALAEFYPSMR